MNRSALYFLGGCVLAQATSLVNKPTNHAQDPTPEQPGVLSYMSLVYLDDGFGNAVPTIRIEGANLQIVNGAGQTYTTNGLGNLIVGYLEAAGAVNRTGSHNVIIGGNDYSSYGGLCNGGGNKLLGSYSAILAGNGNVAQGELSVMVGGTGNSVQGYGSIAISGSDNVVDVGPSGSGNMILGGRNSSITGFANENVIISGYGNSFDEGDYNVIVGGNGVDVVGSYFFGTLGSQGAQVLGMEAGAMVGGSGNTMGDGSVRSNATMVGGQGNVLVDANHATVVGGQGNSATGNWSTVTGGLQRSVSGAHDWAAGGLFQDN